MEKLHCVQETDYAKGRATMTVDHIGYVVDSIEKSKDKFTKQYGFSVLSDIVYDPLQRVRLVMLCSSQHRIELIEPVDEHSPSYDFLKKGGGFHHICFSVADIDASIKKLQGEGHLLFVKPKEAILFGGKKVAFLYSKEDKKIIELVENGE